MIYLITFAVFVTSILYCDTTTRKVAAAPPAARAVALCVMINYTTTVANLLSVST